MSPGGPARRLPGAAKPGCPGSRCEGERFSSGRLAAASGPFGLVCSSACGISSRNGRQRRFPSRRVTEGAPSDSPRPGELASLVLLHPPLHGTRVRLDAQQPEELGHRGFGGHIPSTDYTFTAQPGLIKAQVHTSSQALCAGDDHHPVFPSADRFPQNPPEVWVARAVARSESVEHRSLQRGAQEVFRDSGRNAGEEPQQADLGLGEFLHLQGNAGLFIGWQSRLLTELDTVLGRSGERWEIRRIESIPFLGGDLRRTAPPQYLAPENQAYFGPGKPVIARQSERSNEIGSGIAARHGQRNL